VKHVLVSRKNSDLYYRKPKRNERVSSCNGLHTVPIARAMSSFV